MKPKLIIFLNLYLLLSNAVSAQNKYLKGANWENELPSIRHRYNLSLAGEIGLIRKNTYKFFPTGSGRTGEILQFYRLIQLEDEQDIKAFENIKVRFPAEANLTHLDYRVWKDDVIIYEGKPQSINRQIRDSVFDSRSSRVQGFTLQLSDLEPNVVVELFYQVEGVHLPYWLNFQDTLSWQSSQQEIRIISSDPLRYVHHPKVQVSEKRSFDELVYSFKVDSVESAQKSTGAQHFDTTKYFVALEWKDLVQRYDREKIKTWPDFLPYLFFDDEVKNLSVYFNSEARYLGRNIHSGVNFIPPKRYHQRDDELHENFKQAWGRYRLGSAYAAPLAALQEWVKNLAKADEVSNMAGVKLIDDAVKAYIMNGLADLKSPPFAFYDYGIVSKFYTDFFRFRGMKYYPTFLKARQHGPFLDSLISTRQIDALAIFFEDRGAENMIFIGLYLGSFYGINSLPSDFSEGNALLFDLATGHYHKRQLPKLANIKTGFDFQEDIQLSFKHNWLRSSKDYKLLGNFRNKSYYAYLQNDTALGVLTPTAYQVDNNALGNKDEIKFKTVQVRRPADTMLYHLNLQKALIAQLDSIADIYIFPTPHEVKMSFRLKADKSFELLSMPKFSINEPGLYALDISSERLSSMEVVIKLNLSVEEHIIEGEGTEKFSQIVGLLQRGIPIKIFPKNES